MSKEIIAHTWEQGKYEKFFKYREPRPYNKSFYDMGYGLYGLAKFLTIIQSIKQDAEELFKRAFDITPEEKERLLNVPFEDLYNGIKKIKHVFGW